MGEHDGATSRKRRERDQEAGGGGTTIRECIARVLAEDPASAAANQLLSELFCGDQDDMIKFFEGVTLTEKGTRNSSGSCLVLSQQTRAFAELFIDSCKALRLDSSKLLVHPAPLARPHKPIEWQKPPMSLRHLFRVKFTPHVRSDAAFVAVDFDTTMGIRAMCLVLTDERLKRRERIGEIPYVVLKLLLSTSDVTKRRARKRFILSLLDKRVCDDPFVQYQLECFYVFEATTLVRNNAAREAERIAAQARASLRLERIKKQKELEQQNQDEQMLTPPTITAQLAEAMLDPTRMVLAAYLYFRLRMEPMKISVGKTDSGFSILVYLLEEVFLCYNEEDHRAQFLHAAESEARVAAVQIQAEPHVFERLFQVTQELLDYIYYKGTEDCDSSSSSNARIETPSIRAIECIYRSTETISSSLSELKNFREVNDEEAFAQRRAFYWERCQPILPTFLEQELAKRLALLQATEVRAFYTEFPDCCAFMMPPGSDSEELRKGMSYMNAAHPNFDMREVRYERDKDGSHKRIIANTNEVGLMEAHRWREGETPPADTPMSTASSTSLDLSALFAAVSKIAHKTPTINAFSLVKLGNVAFVLFSTPIAHQRYCNVAIMESLTTPVQAKSMPAFPVLLRQYAGVFNRFEWAPLDFSKVCDKSEEFSRTISIYYGGSDDASADVKPPSDRLKRVDDVDTFDGLWVFVHTLFYQICRLVATSENKRLTEVLGSYLLGVAEPEFANYRWLHAMLALAKDKCPEYPYCVRAKVSHASVASPDALSEGDVISSDDEDDDEEEESLRSRRKKKNMPRSKSNVRARSSPPDSDEEEEEEDDDDEEEEEEDEDGGGGAIHAGEFCMADRQNGLAWLAEIVLCFLCLGSVHTLSGDTLFRLLRYLRRAHEIKVHLPLRRYIELLNDSLNRSKDSKQAKVELGEERHILLTLDVKLANEIHLGESDPFFGNLCSLQHPPSFRVCCTRINSLFYAFIVNGDADSDLRWQVMKELDCRPQSICKDWVKDWKSRPGGNGTLAGMTITQLIDSSRNSSASSSAASSASVSPAPNGTRPTAHDAPPKPKRQRPPKEKKPNDLVVNSDAPSWKKELAERKQAIAAAAAHASATPAPAVMPPPIPQAQTLALASPIYDKAAQGGAPSEFAAAGQKRPQPRKQNGEKALPRKPIAREFALAASGARSLDVPVGRIHVTDRPIRQAWRTEFVRPRVWCCVYRGIERIYNSHILQECNRHYSDVFCFDQEWDLAKILIADAKSLKLKYEGDAAELYVVSGAVQTTPVQDDQPMQDIPSSASEGSSSHEGAIDTMPSTVRPTNSKVYNNLYAKLPITKPEPYTRIPSARADGSAHPRQPLSYVMCSSVASNVEFEQRMNRPSPWRYEHARGILEWGGSFQPLGDFLRDVEWFLYKRSYNPAPRVNGKIIERSSTALASGLWVLDASRFIKHQLNSRLPVSVLQLETIYDERVQCFSPVALESSVWKKDESLFAYLDLGLWMFRIKSADEATNANTSDASATTAAAPAAKTEEDTAKEHTAMLNALCRDYCSKLANVIDIAEHLKEPRCALADTPCASHMLRNINTAKAAKGYVPYVPETTELEQHMLTEPPAPPFAPSTPLVCELPNEPPHQQNARFNSALMPPPPPRKVNVTLKEASEELDALLHGNIQFSEVFGLGVPTDADASIADTTANASALLDRSVRYAGPPSYYADLMTGDEDFDEGVV